MSKKVIAKFIFPRDRTLADMARVVILWAGMEHTINLGIASILNIPHHHYYLTFNPIRSFDTRLIIFKNLVDYEFRRGEIKLANISVLFKKIKEHYDFRNLIAHGQWHTWHDDDPLLDAVLFSRAYALKYQKEKKVMTPKGQELTPDTLQDAIDEFRKTQKEIEKLTHEIENRILKRKIASLKKLKKAKH